MGAFTSAEFAENMLAAAASPERVGTVVARLIGDTVEVGPLSVGPAGVGTVQAVALPGDIVATPCAEADWDIGLAVPIRLRAELTLGVRVVAYDIDLFVRTRLRLILEPPCTVVIDVERLTHDSVTSNVDPHGISSRVLGWLGNVGSIVEDQVITYVNSMLSSEAVEATCRIDVADLLDRAWESGMFIATSNAAADLDERPTG